MIEINALVEGLKQIKAVQIVFLYGSYARGEEKPISDIDICVLTQDINDGLKEKIVSYSSPKIQISLFWELPCDVKYSVLKEGKILLNRNEDLLHKTTVSTMDQYLDFKHIIDRNIARVFG